MLSVVIVKTVVIPAYGKETAVDILLNKDAEPACLNWAFFFSKSVDQILEIIYHFTQIFTPLITMVFNTKKEKKNYFTHVRILKRKHCCSNRGPKDCLNTFYWIFIGAFWLKWEVSVWRKENTAFQQRNLIPSVKRGGGSIVVWACFGASGPGQLAISDETINS